MTAPDNWGNVVPINGLIQVTIYASIRDQNECLMRADEQRRFVGDKQRLRDEVLGFVRRYWPEAMQDDVHWDMDPADWDGLGEIWWTTIAEVDGLVRSVGREALN